MAEVNARTSDKRSGPNWLRLALLGVLLAVIVVALGRLIGDVDWSKVRSAIGQLAFWQLAVLLLGLVVRQTLNALPLALYIPGVSPFRAAQNDQAAILMTTVAPPPSDIAMRLAMFTSWGIPAALGLAGTVMNTVSFYVVRFGAPLLGIVLMVVFGYFDPYELSAAVTCALVSLGLLGMVWVAVRDPGAFGRIAAWFGRIVRRVKKSVDPQAWSDWATDFRDHIVDRVPWAMPRSLLSLVAMVLVDATLIVLALRFVGVESGDLPAAKVIVTFLVAYPLTLFPFAGLGLLDAVLIATVVSYAGEIVEPGVIAALVIWRTVTIITPLLLGVGSIGLWRAQMMRAAAD